MRVFILCTGRSGSSTFIKACEHIDNYSSGHETLTVKFGEERFKFPNNHIEADNRLSWQLGQLNKRFGNDAFYVHLKREPEVVAKSFKKRFFQWSMIDFFCEGIKMKSPEKLEDIERVEACFDYINTVNSNIEFFLLDKTNKMDIDLENIDNDFLIFWNKIGAEGNIENAINEFKTKYNATSIFPKYRLLYRLKKIFAKEWHRVKLMFN